MLTRFAASCATSEILLGWRGRTLRALVPTGQNETIMPRSKMIQAYLRFWELRRRVDWTVFGFVHEERAL